MKFLVKIKYQEVVEDTMEIGVHAGSSEEAEEKAWDAFLDDYPDLEPLEADTEKVGSSF